jgi:hypothetical protein
MASGKALHNTNINVIRAVSDRFETRFIAFLPKLTQTAEETPGAGGYCDEIEMGGKRKKAERMFRFAAR